MARYDVYANPSGDGFLVDVQADALDEFRTRVVIPLFPTETTPPRARRLHPVFRIGDTEYVLATHLISAVPLAELREVRTNLSRHYDEITAALDFLRRGF